MVLMITARPKATTHPIASATRAVVASTPLGNTSSGWTITSTTVAMRSPRTAPTKAKAHPICTGPGSRVSAFGRGVTDFRQAA